MHSCGTTLDPRWACRSQCPKVIYPPVKLIWLAGNSPFPIGNTSSNGGLFHCYVSLPEGNVHLTPCRAVVLLFVGLSRGMGRAHQHVPFFVVCFSYIFFGTRHFPREHLMSYSHCSRGKRPDLYFFRVTSSPSWLDWEPHIGHRGLGLTFAIYRGPQLWDKSCSSMHWWDLVRSGEPVEGSTLANDLQWLTLVVLHPRKCECSVFSHYWWSLHLADKCLSVLKIQVDSILTECHPSSVILEAKLKKTECGNQCPGGTQHRHIFESLNVTQSSTLQTKFKPFNSLPTLCTLMPQRNFMTLRLLLVFPLPASPILTASPENADLGHPLSSLRSPHGDAQERDDIVRNWRRGRFRFPWLHRNRSILLTKIQELPMFQCQLFFAKQARCQQCLNMSMAATNKTTTLLLKAVWQIRLAWRLLGHRPQPRRIRLESCK